MASSAKTPEQKRKEAEKLAREKEKAAAAKAQAEVADLFKPVIQQKVPFGVDPKSILCQYFKAGQCEKGEFGMEDERRGADWSRQKVQVQP